VSGYGKRDLIVQKLRPRYTEALEVSVLKTLTVCVNLLYYGNRLANFSSTFMPNIKLKNYWEVPERAA